MPLNMPVSNRMAPAGCSQNDIALSRGKQRSLAPIWSGTIQLAKPFMSGIAARKIITVPCRVKNELYSSLVRKSLPGEDNWIRIIIARMPPTPRKNSPETK